MSDTSVRTTDPAVPAPRGATPTTAPTARVRRLTGARARRVALDYAIVAALVGVVVAAFVVYPDFGDPDNLRNVLSQAAPVGIVAVGMTLVMIAGGFDLSVGALYAGGATLYASLALDTNLWLAALLTLGAGVVAGALNGLAVTRLRINPFVATLGTASVFSGVAFLYSDSQPFIVTDPAFTTLGRGSWFGVPVAVWLLAAVLLAGGAVLSRTVYGRSLYVVGGNSEAARLAGLRVGLLRGSTYVVVGVCSVLAGMIIASRLSVGQADIGGTIALDAIAVVVIGGTSLFGGEGAMWRTVVGLLILAVLTNLFDSLAVDSNVQSIVKGLIVVGAVSLDALARRHAT